MKDFNSYIDNLDYSDLKKYFKKMGNSITTKKTIFLPDKMKFPVLLVG